MRARVPVVAVLAVTLVCAEARAAAPLSWSRPVRIDTARSSAMSVSPLAVSCASSSFCAAVGGGDVLVTTRPTAAAPSWRDIHLGTSVFLYGISCPSRRFCVAYDGAGDVLSSTHPTGPPSGWRLTSVDTTRRLAGVSCPSASFCAAVDFAGTVFTSTNPSGGRRAWRSRKIGLLRPTAISCPTARLCVAVASTTILVSTDPGSRASSWTPETIPGSFGISGVACPSTSLCVAADRSGHVYTSAHPATGAGAWTLTQLQLGTLHPGGVGGAVVSCARTAVCSVIFGADTPAGVIASTRRPRGGASAWTLTPETGNALSAVSCAARLLCVVAGQTGLMSSTDPTGGAAAWKTVAPGTGHVGLTGIVCPGASLCVAVDSAGNVATTRRPGGSRRAWSLVHVDASPITSLTCPETSLCVGVDGAGDLVSTGNPVGGRRAWTVTVLPGGSVQAAACTRDGLCVAVGGSRALASTHPTGPSRAWRASSVDTTSVPCGVHGQDSCPSSLITVACPSRSLCVAGDDNGNLFASTDPGAAAATWHQVASTSSGEYDYYLRLSVTCPSASLCLAANQEDGLLTSTHPARTWTLTTLASGPISNLSCLSSFLCIGTASTSRPTPGHQLRTVNAVVSSRHPARGAAAWGFAAIQTQTVNEDSLSALACASTRLCVAVDPLGDAFSSVTPAGPARTWGRAHIDVNALTAVACPSRTLCVAVDDYGEVVRGRGR